MKTMLGWVLVLVVMTAGAGDGADAADARGEITTLLDNWHRAAATADEDVFFGSMADGAIYLGTDAGERWTRDELREWAQEHFAKESAWSFKPYDRTIYLSDDGRMAWFEELLETWMGVCRGSGVLVLGKDGWKIAHYNLAVTVPNEVIEDFIAIVEKAPKASE